MAKKLLHSLLPEDFWFIVLQAHLNLIAFFFFFFSTL